MLKKYLRLGVWGILSLFFLTLFPGSALTQEKPAVSLEQAIRIAKENFNIPSTYSNFHSTYTQDRNRQLWHLNWEAIKEPHGSLNVQIEANTGDIIFMRYWKDEPGLADAPRLPAFSEAEARDLAVETLQRLAPDKAGNLRLVPRDLQVIPLNQAGPVTYEFRWERMVNGIPFIGDGAQISIRGDNGEVSYYGLDWTEATFPGLTGVIDPAKAQETFTQTGMLELQYHRLAAYQPLRDGGKPSVILVYRLNHPANGVIDAFTGEPLILEPGQWLRDNVAGLGGGASAEMMQNKEAIYDEAEAIPLSPEELAEVEKTAGLLSQAEAAAVVKKWIDLPASLSLQNAHLSMETPYSEGRLWNFSWQAKKPEKGELEYVNARVEARTGELMGFNLSYPAAAQKADGSMERARAQKIAEDFLMQVQPGRFKNVALDEKDPANRPLLTPEETKSVSHTFNYVRMVNGIPFPGNGLQITIDTAQEKITHFNVNWQELDFPSTTGCLGHAAANPVFLEKQPLTLGYTMIYNAAGEEVKPVYLPITAPNELVSGLMDARTGEFLDWQGKPITQQPRAYEFTDLAGYFGAEEIRLLGQAGIFGEYNDTFRPLEKISAVSLLRAMLQVNQGPMQIDPLTESEVIARAVEMKWIEEGELVPADAVTREKLAKLLIRSIGLERAARIKGIYQVPYTDAAALSPGALGYVSLAWGLEIIKGTGETFVPEQQITRGEAAVGLVRALNAGK